MTKKETVLGWLIMGVFVSLLMRIDDDLRLLIPLVLSLVALIVIGVWGDKKHD